MSIRKHPVAVTPEGATRIDVPLDSGLVSRLKESYAVLLDRRIELADIFYAKLFEASPGVRSMFPADIDTQARKLVAALDTIVSNLESPEKNAGYLREMGRRHEGYGAKLEHYELVAQLLVESMQEISGGRLTVQDLAEWRTSLLLVGKMMSG